MKCQTPPIFRYTWPGKDEAYACPEHAVMLLKTAYALDLHLQMIQLNADEMLKAILSGAICSQELKDPE